MWGRGGTISLPNATVTSDDLCVKMGSDESHFNVFTARGNITKQCPQTITFVEKGRIEPENRTDIIHLPAWCLTAKPNKWGRGKGGELMNHELLR